MPTDLLDRLPFEHTIKPGRRGDVYPAMMELEVNGELAPILVTSTRGVLWVSQVSVHRTVRVAVRSRTGLEADIVSAIVEKGQALQWGNVHPLTTEGIRRAAAHVRSYGLDPLELLVSPATDRTNLDGGGLSWVEAPWVPLGTVVVLPVDRVYVGVLGTLGATKAVAVVHNASRGVGVAFHDDDGVARSSDPSVAVASRG